MEKFPEPAPVLHTEFNVRDQEDLSIQKAISILEERMFKRGPHLTMPLDAQNYLRLQLAKEIREVFSCIFLDSSHRILAYEPLFFGTIDTTSAHPRIILLRALEHNSSAVILAHNHPSGVVTPSKCDIALTKHLRKVLSHVEVRLLDHFIIGEGEPYSFAEAGLL
ncbi:DNA repair protein RadC [Pseudomonas sp. 91RF]|jgi:DNA repair protein RadC|uniref:JAB domain-containing protein n=1 Tax=Pseudomonas sp. 91RF TaxID=2292261 RepID=UPI000E674AD8|nr:JAB domain-containing protein [Pseudomonas sp. 91RF]RIJ09668.1 DNA repair protein RadC [Pseudomonas sp. 91RF]